MIATSAIVTRAETFISTENLRLDVNTWTTFPLVVESAYSQRNVFMTSSAPKRENQSQSAVTRNMRQTGKPSLTLLVLLVLTGEVYTANNMLTGSSTHIPSSEYVASQYYLPICALPALLAMLYMSRSKPVSERYPALQLLGGGGGLLVLFMQSQSLPCVWLTIWEQALPPVSLLPVVLQIYRFDKKCQFREAMKISDIKQRLKTLLRLKRMASYNFLAGVFLTAMIPYGFIIGFTYFSSDDFRSSTNSYMNYTGKGFCALGHFEKNVGAFMATAYSVTIFKLARKVSESEDEFGIISNIRRISAVGVFVIAIFAIVLFVDIAYTFYVLRVGYLLYVYGMAVPQIYDTWAQKQCVEVGSSMSLQYIFSKPMGLETFRSQLAAEFSAENLDFWVAVNTLENSTEECGGGGGGTEVHATKAREIYDMYVPESAPLQINIPSKLLQTLKADAHAGRFKPSMFSEAKEEIFSLMERDALPRYKRGPYFRQFKEQLAPSEVSSSSSNPRAASAMSLVALFRPRSTTSKPPSTRPGLSRTGSVKSSMNSVAPKVEETLSGTNVPSLPSENSTRPGH